MEASIAELNARLLESHSHNEQMVSRLEALEAGLAASAQASAQAAEMSAVAAVASVAAAEQTQETVTATTPAEGSGETEAEEVLVETQTPVALEAPKSKTHPIMAAFMGRRT
jgi:hypothetical protein